jgi:hypothetical protein
MSDLASALRASLSFSSRNLSCAAFFERRRQKLAHVPDLGSIRFTQVPRIGRRRWCNGSSSFALLEDAGMSSVFRNALHDGARFGIHLDELDPHPRWILCVTFVASPNDSTDSVQQRRLILKDELELQKRAHR